MTETEATANQQSPQRCTAAVVVPARDPRGIDFERPLGTAFLVNSEGFVATNAHVARAAEQCRNNVSFIRLMYPSRFFSKRFQGAPLDASVILSTAAIVAVDESLDVALLQTID